MWLSLPQSRSGLKRFERVNYYVERYSCTERQPEVAAAGIEVMTGRKRRAAEVLQVAEAVEASGECGHQQSRSRLISQDQNLQSSGQRGMPSHPG